MLKLESYKLFKRKIVLLIITVIFAVILLHEINFIKAHEYYQQDLELMEKYNGIYTDVNFAKFFDDMEKVCDETEVSYYKSYYFDGERQKTKEEIFKNLDFDIYFGHHHGWSRLFYRLAIYLKFMPIFIVIAFAGLFSYENECRMQEILLSTKNGRSKCSKAKLKMAFIVTNVLFFIIVLITLINTLLMIRGQGWNSSIQLYIWLMDSKLDINNLWMFIHAVFLAFLSVNFIVLVILLISLKVKNPAISMCISFGILYALRNDLMNVIFDDNNIISHIVSITPVNIFEGLHMAGLEPVKVAGITVQWLYMAEILYIILLAATIVIFYRVLKNNHKYCAE